MIEEGHHIGDMLILEEEGIYIELEHKRRANVHFDMLETMRSLKANLESSKADNAKLLRVKYEQEELNELFIKKFNEQDMG